MNKYRRYGRRVFRNAQAANIDSSNILKSRGYSSVSRFLRETGTRSAVHITMITTYGLSKKGHFGVAQSEVTLNDLYAM